MGKVLLTASAMSLN